MTITSTDLSLQAAEAVTFSDQLETEALVRELWDHPAVVAGRKQVAGAMLNGCGIDVPDEAKPRFESIMDEYAASYVARAVARDRSKPRIPWLFNPPMERAGTPVLATRFCGDNPDCIYRWGGLRFPERYRLTGRPTGPIATAVSFAVVRNFGATKTGASIELEELERNPDGSFVIHFGPEPANGRPNHLQIDARSQFLLVRECLSDWNVESPLHFSLECDSATGGDPDLDAIAEEAVHWMTEELPLYFWTTRIFRNMQPNTVKKPVAAGTVGGYPKYVIAPGFFQIKEDEAIVFNWDPADAPYASITLHDWWFVQVDAHRIQSSLTAAQADRNSDGTITAVYSTVDPGIANWLELDGLRNALATFRWYGRIPPEQAPAISAELIKLNELEQHIPPGTRRVSRAEREQRNAERMASFARRIGREGFRLD